VENWWKSGNVIENKGSYALRAGMLLKRNRIQDSGVRSQNEEHLISASYPPLTAYCGRRWQVGNERGWRLGTGTPLKAYRALSSGYMFCERFGLRGSVFGVRHICEPADIAALP